MHKHTSNLEDPPGSSAVGKSLLSGPHRRAPSVFLLSLAVLTITSCLSSVPCLLFSFVSLYCFFEYWCLTQTRRHFLLRRILPFINQEPLTGEQL